MQQLKNNYKKYGSGFTLVELLVVITILGILATIGLEAFTSAQMRGRDTERKSDLKQLTNALGIFYSDYGKYPPGSGGLIGGCQYNPANGTGVGCSWGGGPFTDGKTVYFETMPNDPTSNFKYYYRIVDSGTNQEFQLFARLENSQDPSCIGGNCGTRNDLPAGVNCGSGGSCNFAITSPNTTPTQ